EAADKGVKEFSGGMRRRLDLATSMILAPQVLPGPDGCGDVLWITVASQAGGAGSGAWTAQAFASSCGRHLSPSRLS
ncbi:hypothetical protein AB0C60_33035, partial [Streptomyces sp. NPDC048845]